MIRSCDVEFISDRRLKYIDSKAIPSMFDYSNACVFSELRPDLIRNKPSKIHGNDQTRDENHENWHSEHAIRC